MAIKKTVAVKKVKAKVAVKKPVVKVEAPVNFPVKTFVFVSVLVFVFASLFITWWSFLSSSNNVDSLSSTSWIYSRHKFDMYRAANCGGDPLITMPQCPRVQ